MDPKRLTILRRRLSSKAPLVAPWLRRRAINVLVANEQPEGVRTLARAWAKESSPEIMAELESALSKLKTQTAIDAVVSVWNETRHKGLERLIRERHWIASLPLQLKVTSALRFGQPAKLRDDGPAVVLCLIRACEDPDRTIAARAVALLAGFHDQSLIEAFCAELVWRDLPDLRRLAIRKGYAPRDPSDRALYFFATGQMNRYESLDFDHRLLRAICDQANPELRELIAARIRSSGRPQLAAVLHRDRSSPTQAGPIGKEWEALVAALRDGKRHDELWAIAFEAPPERSAEILRLLKRCGYRPSREADRTAFDRLVKWLPAEGGSLRFDWPTPRLLAVHRKRAHGVRSLAFAPTSSLLATVGIDNTVLLWETDEARPKVPTAKSLNLSVVAAFSPDGRFLALAGLDQTIRLWEISTWRQTAALSGHKEKLSGLSFTPDSQSLASASYDRTIRVWDCATAKCRATLTGHRASIIALAISPDHRTIASASHDETVRLWHLRSGEPKSSWKTGDWGPVQTLAFSPDAKILATGSPDGLVRLWQASNGELNSAFAAHKRSVTCLAFAPDGQRIATAGLDGTVRLWDTAGKSHATLECADEMSSVAFSPNGQRLAAAGRDGEVKLWEVAYSQPLLATSPQDLAAFEECADRSRDAIEARPWHFLTALVRHRQCFEIELTDTVRRVLSEFDIEIEARGATQGSPKARG